MQLNATPQGKFIDVEALEDKRPMVDKVIGKFLNDNRNYLK